MANNTQKKVAGFLGLGVFVVAVVLTVLDATVMETSALHPLLLMLGVLLVGGGVVTLIFAFGNKLGGLSLVSAILLSLGALYFCLDFIEPINAVVCIVVPIGVFVLIVGLAFVGSFKGTSIEFDNDSKDYKTYREKQNQTNGNNEENK